MQDRQELIDTYLVKDDRGQISTVEVWAAVTYLDEFGLPRRTVGARAFCLRDGSRLIRQCDDSFFNASTGKVVRRIWAMGGA